MVTSPELVTAGGVLRDADAAMYAAKAAGKGRVSVFNPEDQLHNLREEALSSAFSEAVERDEFEVHFQPTFSIGDHRLRGFEALVRWRHRSRGLLMPGDFLAVAESTGQIEQMGAWVLDRACRQAITWHSEFSGLVLPISVNVSGHELARTDYAATVQRALEQTGVDPMLLAVEVSELVLLQDLVAIAQQLQRIKELGSRVVLDDYGLGQSSVSALRSLGIAALKVDGSQINALTAEIVDGTRITAALTVARELGVPVIAEGVESWATLARVKKLGFDLAQGYVFGQPGPAEQLRALLWAEREHSVEPSLPNAV